MIQLKVQLIKTCLEFGPVQLVMCHVHIMDTIKIN